MSANACIVYFGLRFDVTVEEIEGLEDRTDARIAAARKGGLKYYWANFSDNVPKYLFFVGTELSVIGPENALAANCTFEQMQTLISSTKTKLDDAGFSGEPSLHMQWQPDF